jgi:hypothetical protein
VDNFIQTFVKTFLDTTFAVFDVFKTLVHWCAGALVRWCTGALVH